MQSPQTGVRFHPAFTIVELLIVVVVIAILAAISVVAFTGIQNRAYDSAVESDLSTVAKSLGLVKADLGRYPQVTSEFPAGFKFAKGSYQTTSNNAMYCLNQVTDEYALMVVSRSGIRYLLMSSGVQKDVAASYADPCTAVGTSWSSPPVARTAIHGYRSGGGPPTYTPDGWSAGWNWTNDS